MVLKHLFLSAEVRRIWAVKIRCLMELCCKTTVFFVLENDRRPLEMVPELSFENNMNMQ